MPRDRTSVDLGLDRSGVNGPLIHDSGCLPVGGRGSGLGLRSFPATMR